MSVGILIEETPLLLRAARVEEGEITALRYYFPGRPDPLWSSLYRAKVVELDKRLGAAFLDLGTGKGFLRRTGPLPDIGSTLIAEVRREPIGDKGADLSDRPALRLPMATVQLGGQNAIKPGPLGEAAPDPSIMERIETASGTGCLDPRPVCLRLLMTLLDGSVMDIAVTQAGTKNRLSAYLPPDIPVEIMPSREAALMLDEAEERGLALHHSLPGGGALTIEETEALFAVDLDLGRQGGQSKKGAGTKLLGEALSALGHLGPIMGLGGQVIIDVPRGAIAAPKIVRDQITRALKPMGRVSVPAVTPEGICVVIAPRSRPSLRHLLTEAGEDPVQPGRRLRVDALAAKALRHAERALEDNRTGTVTLFVTERAIPLLAPESEAVQNLLSRFGPRLAIRSLRSEDRKECFHVKT